MMVTITPEAMKIGLVIILALVFSGMGLKVSEALRVESCWMKVVNLCATQV